MKFALIASILALSLSSCFKEENPMARKDRGSVVTGVTEMGPDYSREIYYSFLSKNNIKSIGKFTWDIGVSGSIARPFIVLNTSRSMSAYKTTFKSFSEVRDTIGKMQNILIDYPCGDPDSLALRDILKEGLVHIIDLGYDASAQKRGFLLLKASLQNNAYYIEHCNLDGSNYQSKTISFDDIRHLIFYSFSTGDILPEPALNEWDVLMTQYQHVYYDPFQTYSVAGCLINQSTIIACEYKGNKNFNDIQADDTAGCTFSGRRDIIGFGWKHFDLGNNQYIINSKKTYFLRRRHNGMLYKLHFIDFYSSTGAKGTATFEFQEL